MKINLYELADDRRDVLKKIRDNEENLTEHLLYLLLFPDQSELKSHWKPEIIKWLKPCVKKIRIGKSVRNLTQQELFNVLFIKPFENGVEDYKTNYVKNSAQLALWDKKDLLSKYRSQDIPVDLWKSKFKKFYENISQVLSTGDFDIDYIEKELEEFEK